MNAESPHPPTVLLAPRVTQDSVRVWEAAISLGWPVRRLPSWRVPEGLAEAGSEYLIYAEPLFAEAVSDQLALVLLEPPCDWLPTLPKKFTKRQISTMLLEEARKLDGPVFVKPAEGKVFEAKVYTHGTQLPGPETVDGTLTVLCSEPVTFKTEFRSFILNGQILALSPYWRNGTLAQDGTGAWPFVEDEEGEVRTFMTGVLAAGGDGHPPAFVLDVGETLEHGWAVIEANPCWGAGLYGCPASAVLHACRAAIKPRKSMREEEWQWTSPRVRRTAA